MGRDIALRRGPLILIIDLVTIAQLTVSNSSRNVILNITPNAFPAVRLIAKRDLGDDTPVNYVQVGRSQAQPPKDGDIC